MIEIAEAPVMSKELILEWLVTSQDPAVLDFKEELIEDMITLGYVKSGGN